VEPFLFVYYGAA